MYTSQKSATKPPLGLKLPLCPRQAYGERREMSPRSPHRACVLTTVPQPDAASAEVVEAGLTSCRECYTFGARCPALGTPPVPRLGAGVRYGVDYSVDERPPSDRTPSGCLSRSGRPNEASMFHPTPADSRG